MPKQIFVNLPVKDLTKTKEFWVYSRSFQDPDGHLWEVLYTDENAIPQG
jgi:predicted lactoylglutathione lyase